MKTSLWSKLKRNVFGILGFFFCVVLPVILLSELMAFANFNIKVKLTFMGCLAVIILFIVFYKRIKQAVNKVNNLIAKECVLMALRGFWWVIGLGLIIGLIKLGENLQRYWWHVGICFLIGSAFYILHAIKKQKFNEVNKANERIKLKEEIKAELNNE